MAFMGERKDRRKTDIYIDSAKLLFIFFIIGPYVWKQSPG